MSNVCDTSTIASAGAKA